MKKIILICLFGLLFSAIQGQLSDDFSDGNMTESPAWFGDTQDFFVNESLKLQLDAESEGNSRLCTSFATPDSVRWDMYLNIQFATSSSNKLRVYLLLDTIDLVVANGYYLEVGQNGSADPIHFFSLENGEAFLLGSSLMTFEEEVDLLLSVLRDIKGNWTFYADKGDGNVIEILNLNDIEFQPELSNFFCLECFYTATRRDKFIFDDIRAQPLKPDLTPPILIHAAAVDSNTLELIFNENIGIDVKNDNIRIEPGIGNPSKITIINHKLQIELGKELKSGRTYTCSTFHIPDTAQNVSDQQETPFRFITVSPPLHGDMVINEVLFDPKSDDYPFIEIYNASDKYFSCNDIVISIEKNNAFTLFSNATDCLIYPDSFIVFTSNRLSTILNYPSNRESAIMEAGLPVLSRDFGSIVLQTKSGKVIDSVYYEAGFHHILLDETRGVSLERISPTARALTRADWNSASAQSGWGTPGLPNSQYVRFDSVTTAFRIENQFFTPDGDGQNDFLLIRFADETAGQLATARVYDEFGREVSVLFRNELLGSGSTGKWDGTADSEGMAPTGIYILLIEMMDERGIVNGYKEAVTLATGI